MEYKKVSKDDVFKKIVDYCTDGYGPGFVPSSVIRHVLKTSRYQVYKYTKELREDNMIQHDKYYIHPDNRFDPEDHLPKIVFVLTRKARRHPYYREKMQETIETRKNES